MFLWLAFRILLMSYRFMRVIVFFDLPTETAKDRREYARFRKHLVKSGFVMMQESVYTKLALNQNAADEIAKGVKKSKPPAGLVQILSITEKQFSRMEIVVGEIKSDVIAGDERVVLL